MPISLPTLVTCTPTIVRGPPSGDPAVAMRTLYAGRKPPSAIFITRASASVVDARAGLSDGLRLACSSSTGRDRRFDAALEIGRRGQTRQMLRARQLRIVGLHDDGLEVQRRLLAALQQGLEPPKRRRRRRSADTDAVLRDDVE